MGKYDSYIICTSPRSGSTLLCKLLSATGVAGKPESYFHEPSVSSWLRNLNPVPIPSDTELSDLDWLFKAVIAEGSLDTGMFGLRLQRHSVEFFLQQLAVLYPGLSGDAERICAAFGETAFIHLTRCNKIEQAVSYVKAEQTGLWHMAPDGTELERLAPPQALTYDPDAIRTRVDEVTACDEQWEDWFQAQRMDMFRITYEELSDHPARTLSRLLDHLGLDRDAARGVESSVAKLADKTSNDWVVRFGSE